MRGQVGDAIIVESAHVGEPPRHGRILEVIEPAERSASPHYRVRWDDGHESVFFPQAGSARIVPGEHAEVG